MDGVLYDFKGALASDANDVKPEPLRESTRSMLAQTFELLGSELKEIRTAKLMRAKELYAKLLEETVTAALTNLDLNTSCRKSLSSLRTLVLEPPRLWDYSTSEGALFGRALEARNSVLLDATREHKDLRRSTKINLERIPAGSGSADTVECLRGVIQEDIIGLHAEAESHWSKGLISRMRSAVESLKDAVDNFQRNKPNTTKQQEAFDKVERLVRSLKMGPVSVPRTPIEDFQVRNAERILYNSQLNVLGDLAKRGICETHWVNKRESSRCIY